MPMILALENVSKSFPSGGRELKVLDNVSLQVEEGTTLAIIGPSGSGKTTLLGLCAGLDNATEGRIELAGIRIDTMDEDQRAQVRNTHVGFIFQNFQLLPTLTAIENVMVPLELQGIRNPRQKALGLLEKVGLKDRAQHYPSQLSGGEQQRVSLARAFSNSPRILFADEPTGNLDGETSARIEDLMFELNREAGTTLVLVTHNNELAERTGRIIRLKGGRLVEDSAIPQRAAE